MPDPEQDARTAHIRAQIEAYKEQQRGVGRHFDLPAHDAAAPHSAPGDMPTDAGLIAGTQDDNAVAYLQRSVVGFTAMMFFSGPVGPFQRDVFLTKDLRSIAWHRPAADVLAGAGQQEDEAILVADVKTIAAGHRTEVFRQHRDQAQVPLREAAALSIITQQQTSVDVEFERPEERDYWAQILSTIAQESRPGNAIHSVLASDRVRVIDTSNAAERSANGEPYDRRHITVRLA